MFQFEDELFRLKHEVLTRVAILAKQNNLTKEAMKNIPYEMIKGDKPKYRDNVQREREILLERIKLACGYIPNRKNNEDLVDISEEKQILYTIKAACDRCPIKRFEVTDACRNCIAHRCKSVCNFGAISYINGRAHIDSTKCRECGMCKKACPYDAIAEDMRPCKKTCPTGAIQFNKDDLSCEINENKCINCGSCMAACPFGAIEDKSCIVKVVNELMSDGNVYAITAPAIGGQFNIDVKYGQIKDAILNLGFKDMIEVACGADAVVIHGVNEFINRLNNGELYMTNSCCPAFLSYIEKMFPSQKGRISKTVSPMVATGRYIKLKDQNAKVVFIGPCTAKKNEIMLESVKDSVDYAITFEELFALLDAFEIDIDKCNDIEVNDASILGRGFAAEGGIINAIERYIKEMGLEIEFNPIKSSGGIEIKKTMTMAKSNKLNGNFIEGMMCEGGCINGPSKLNSIKKGKYRLNKINKQGKIENISSNEKLKEFDNVNLKK